MPKMLTQSNPQAALVDLSLSAVALCNEGANSRADILLYKRKETNSMPKTFEELMAALDTDAAAVVTKHIETLRAADQATIKNLQGEVDTLKTAAPAAQAPAHEEDVLKGASPEIRALFEKMQGTVNQLLAAQEASVVEERYQKCKALPCEEATLREVLKSASPATVPSRLVLLMRPMLLWRSLQRLSPLSRGSLSRRPSLRPVSVILTPTRSMWKG